MLAPDLRGRDLRVTSQTGSGKTVAIGLVLRDVLRNSSDPEDDATTPALKDNHAHPRALVVTPTRELAKQVEEELSWLFAPLARRVVSVTGGAGYRDELRAFRSKPAVIVGTPGRLLDHLNRGAIDAGSASAIVLDEADRMLDMGFREDIEAIFDHLPEGHRTHLMSATFPREVRALADRVQDDPFTIEATPHGKAHADIEHVIHLVDSRERLAAIINLLLENTGGQTLVFAKTRIDVAELSDALNDAGFNVAMLSGEMEQPERNRALAAFKRGHVDALVATDVAARGIDVQGVDLVLHAEPPTDADAYTHRSGRTGRAGRKGTSAVLVTPGELNRTTALLNRARVPFRFVPVPAAESIREARDESLMATLTADFVEGEAIDPRSLALAERVLHSSEPARAVARLVQFARRWTTVEPREVTPISPPQPKDKKPDQRRGKPTSFERSSSSFVPFRVSWGEAHGAEPRRLVAMMCRRGNIEGRDIGAIRVGRTSSVVEVSSAVAESFEQAATKPDPRDPRIHIRRWIDQLPPTKQSPPRPPPPERASKKKLGDERPSKKNVATAEDRPSKSVAVVEDRPSKRSAAEDRPSKKNAAEDRPSKKKLPEDRPSKRDATDRAPRPAAKKTWQAKPLPPWKRKKQDRNRDPRAGGGNSRLKRRPR